MDERAKSDLEMGFLGDEHGSMLASSSAANDHHNMDLKDKVAMEYQLRSPKSHPAEIVDQVRIIF